MPNRLASETSPYLLQHANNPVDWNPWGAEALERSRIEDKPIFLSIGYAACHWCHVMEHESFEDPDIAAMLNQHFVCIKVDREERPDLDQIYMNAIQLISGRGGWPMSVFLAPNLQPFFGGTYWPPHAGRGMPGFDQIILAVDDAWRNRREHTLEQAAELTKHLQQVVEVGTEPSPINFEVLQAAALRLEQTFDFSNGGFGAAPKFPHSLDLQVLLRVWRRTRRDGLLDIVRINLEKMARGGIYDHLAGGFARYSVDDRWLVPHFEKMLYDNGLLTQAYLEMYQATGELQYARVAQETLDYILKYMTDANGGFHSTEDADSEGEEGKFYVWTTQEVHEILGPKRAERFCYVYDITEEGNFEGHNILNLPKSIEQCAALKNWDLKQLRAELDQARAELLHARDQRIRPGKDDKILVSWNGLMISAMARAADVLAQPKYLLAATQAADFIYTEMRRPDGRLLHSWRAGQAKLDAYLDDYTYLIDALVTLYESGFEERWIDWAVSLTETVLAHFSDPAGGFYFIADDHEQLIARNKDYHDSSVPSSNGMAATALLRLGKLTGRRDILDAAQGTIESAGPFLTRAPTASAQMLIAADMLNGPTPEIVVVGDPTSSSTQDVLSELRRRFVPNRVLACRVPDSVQNGSPNLGSLFEGKSATRANVVVYICQNFVCQVPAVGREDALAAIAKAVS